MNLFKSYIAGLVVVFLTTLSVIATWIIPKFGDSNPNKVIILLFLFSLVFLVCHSAYSLFRKYRSADAFKNGYKVKLVKTIHGDTPKILEKTILLPFLPSEKLRIQDGNKEEFVNYIVFDSNLDHLTAVTLDDNRVIDDELPMKDVASEYSDRGWKNSK